MDFSTTGDDRDVDMTVLMVVPSESRQNLTRDYGSEIAALRPIAGRSYLFSGGGGTFYDPRHPLRRSARI